MRDCASYDTTGTVVSGCAKVNFIYGPNGSGKSTISNYLRSSNEHMYDNSEIRWSPGEHAELIVYNRRFRDANFGASDIPGVFTLGEAAIEEIKAVEELKSILQRQIEERDKRKETKTKEESKKSELTSAFRETVWEARDKDHLSPLRQAFTGYLSSKDKFMREVLRRFDKGVEVPSDFDSLKSRALTLFGDRPEKVERFYFTIEDIRSSLMLIETDEIWNTVIIGNEDAPVGKLIQLLGNADWVNSGRKYIKIGEVCPFCQKTAITEELKTQLDEFFSGEYENQCKIITEYCSSQLNLRERLKNIFDGLKLQESSIIASRLDIAAFDAASMAILQALDANLAVIKTKLDEPSRKVELVQTEILFQAIVEIVNTANAAIDKHNATVDHFCDEYSRLVEDIWTYFISENHGLITQYKRDFTNKERAIAGIGNIIDKASADIDTLREKIIDAEKNITSTQPTVDEINRTLAAYGFTNFKIMSSPHHENSYQIQRLDGSLASDTLSEGEETFISFLYFMQLAKGATSAEHVAGKKILVIDDPICSLDSTVLYIVSAMVKELITQVRDGKSDVEQIFILTHNVFFHKEASFINGRSSENGDTHYWIIRKDEEHAVIKSYGMHNPISTSYELLWKELKDNESTSSVVIQNIMRRIIENYFGMVGNKKDEYIENSFETPEDQMICRSLLYWINDGSHCIPDDLYIDSYTPSISKYKDVFHRIFIETGNEAHYNMMMGIPKETSTRQ